MSEHQDFSQLQVMSKYCKTLLRKYFCLAGSFGLSSGFQVLMLFLTGLRYDDLYDPMHDLDVKGALNRLPREIIDARIQRLKCGMDLSMKHQYLPEDLQVLFAKCCQDVAKKNCTTLSHM